MLLPPGYGTPDDTGDILVALLLHPIQGTVLQTVLYWVFVSVSGAEVDWTEETGATVLLFGGTHTVDWSVLVIVDVVMKVRV